MLRRPEDVQGVRRIIGTVTYLSKFVPNLSGITEPLRQLLTKDTTWHWDAEQEEAFNKIKEYTPAVKYVPGKDIPLADTLSRDCRRHQVEEEIEAEIEVCVVILYSQTVLEQLRRETNADPLMASLKRTLMTGWPENEKDLDYPLRQFWNYRDKITVMDDIVFKNSRPMIPTSLHARYLQLAHRDTINVTSST
ncbi:uncharacterized protein [Temnothorax longispinosus]|uniref:uncharacterized protein n=1 Tax=Temnothorax longispinosus TaxID=300112 RepID=UPI003A9932E4